MQAFFRNILCLLPLLLPFSLAEARPNLTQINAAPMNPIDSGLRIELNSKGEETYYRKLETGLEERITEQLFQDSIEELFKKVLKFACKLSIIPNAVTVSIGWGGGGFGIVWNLNQNLCKPES